MQKILVPTDFSESADNALETACNIVKRTKGQVVLLHVVESSSHSTFSITGEMDFESQEERFFTIKLIEKARGEIDARINTESYKDIDFKTEIHVGNPYHGIKSIISEQDVDMIVMGTTGTHSLEEYLVGSTTEKVVRYAKCPVLTVHKKQTNFDYNNIVFATSLHEDEKECLSIVKNAQKIYDAKLHLVRINTPNNFERDKDSLDTMKEYAEKNNLENYTLNVFNDVTEEEGIIYFADHINADLIALATHGRTGFAHLLSGSIAEDVVSHANRPVLTHVIKG